MSAAVVAVLTWLTAVVIALWALLSGHMVTAITATVAAAVLALAVHVAVREEL